ncbi:MAG: SAM hydrolase/SAM-dependent halogenase family protein [Nanobdellota archaeon]
MIVLLTDFGENEYVGAMKAVIRSIDNDSTITTLSNNIPKHSVREGAWVLLNNYSLFPKGTVFLCVVDPGVGSERKSIAIRTKDYCFIGPDNGLMYPAAKDNGIMMKIKLDEKNASDTFHGRDVFAPAAARVRKNLDILKTGKRTSIKTLKFHRKKDEGEVVRIDDFGNIITNIKRRKKEYRLGRRKLKVRESYSEAGKNELFLIEGSSKTLEISRKEASANSTLKKKVGNKVILR